MCWLLGPSAHLARTSRALYLLFVVSQRVTVRMSHVSQFDPPIPAQVAAIASAPPHLHLGGWVGWGPPQTIRTLSHSWLSRVATSFLPYAWRSLAVRILSHMTLLLHRRGHYHPMSTPPLWMLAEPARWLVRSITGKLWTRLSRTLAWCIWGRAPRVGRPLGTIVIHVSVLATRLRCRLV